MKKPPPPSQNETTAEKRAAVPNLDRTLLTTARQICWLGNQIDKRPTHEQPEAARLVYRGLFREAPPPQDLRFWQTVEDMAGRATKEWTEKAFRKLFTQRHGKSAPQGWAEAAVKILAVLGFSLFIWARPWEEQSRQLRQNWEAGSEEALVVAVQVGLIRAPWVAEAIGELQGQQSWGTPAEQSRATEILKRVGTALWRQKGRPPKLTPAVVQQIRAIYNTEHAFCRQFKQECQKPYRTSRERSRRLAELFKLTSEEVAQGEEACLVLNLKPSEWARQRTQEKIGYHEEAIRRALLNSSPRDRV